MNLKSIIILITFIICSSFKCQQIPETGWYFIETNKLHGITFEDLDSHKSFTIERLPIITTIDIKSVKLINEKLSGIKIQKLQLKLTAAGNKKWNLAVNEMSSKNKAAIFVFENKVFCHLFVNGKADYVSPSIVDNDLNSFKLKNVYDSMPENIKK